MSETIDISELCDPALIHPCIKKALENYAEHGIPTGGFLAAVISNDLMTAVGRADNQNIRVLRSICGFVHNELPSGSHGSREIYKNWIEAKKFAGPVSADIEPTEG